MNPNSLTSLSRREMLKSTSVGFGSLALASLCAQAAEQNPLAPKAPHFKPKAKRVIFLCMRGGPSHVDTFDYKPQLTVDEGKPGLGRRGSSSRSKLMASPWKFSQHGQNGLWIS
ncbi:MAG TPA: DUF1501 domain-containing protein, partial [Verrucomicrobiota bacterium]|nr:DUF1501 domain-containing protein [Verrucomicrobiota bacterium]